MNPDLTGKLLALSAALLWSVAVIFFKRSGETIKPLALNLYKSSLALIIFFPVLLICRVPLLPSSASLRDYALLAASGFLGITLADSLFFISLNRLGAGLSAIVDCLYSPMLIGLSVLVLHDPFSLAEGIGGLLIISAILMATLKLSNNRAPARKIMSGIALGSLSTALIAVGVILMKPILASSSPLWVMMVRLTAGTTGLWLQVAMHPERKPLLASLRSPQAWRATLVATILGTVLSMLCWISAFKLTTITSAAILNQTHTVIVVILAAVFLDEEFSRRRLIAAVLAFTGSLLIIASK